MWTYLLLCIPLVGILVTWLSSVSIRRWVPVLTTGLNLVAAGFDVLWRTRSRSVPGVFTHLDTLSLVVTGITLVVGFTASLYSAGYVPREHPPVAQTRATSERRYFSLFLAFYLAMLAVPLVENVVLTWVMVDATALASVFLVDFHHTKKTAEASWKYIILMEVGGLAALFGTVALLIGEPATARVLTWTGITQIASSISPKSLSIAYVLVLVGYGTKAGLVPFNAWLPDAHSQAPSPISAMLSAIKLNTAMYAIVRVSHILQAGHEAAFANHALAGFGFLTVIVSTLMTTMQHDVKRLFAYSSSENLGLIAVGFALGPIGTLGAYLQMVNHSVIKSMLFYQSGELLLASGTTEMAQMRGMIRRSPWLGVTLLFGMLAIAGAPPFGLFMSEFTIIFALVHEASPWLAALIALMLVILFANFLTYAMRISLGRSPDPPVKERGTYRPRWTTWVPMFTHTGASLALGIFLPYLLVASRFVRI